jgi:hypothetical protein
MMGNFSFKIPENPGYHNRFGFPYRTTLSFVPYIQWLEQLVKEKSVPDVMMFRHVLRVVKKCPELLQPIEDLSVLDKYRKEVDLMLSTIIPTSMQDDLTVGVIVPFQPITVYGTSGFNRMVGNLGNGVWDFRNMNPEKAMRDLTAFAGLGILNKHYQFHLAHPEIMKGAEVDKVSGATNYFKPEINPRFSIIKTLKKPRSLSEIDLSPLKDDFFNPEFWLTNFPTDTFAFEGITVYRLVDISDRELVSQIEFGLLQSFRKVSKDWMDGMLKTFRSYFKIPDLKMGAVPVLKNSRQMINVAEENWCCLIPYSMQADMQGSYPGSVYEQAVMQRKPLVIDDVRRIDTRNPLNCALADQGMRSLILAPIFSEDQLLGMLELGAEEPNMFTFLSVLKLKEILPLVTMAFERISEDYNSQVQSTMKEYFTAIHPVVEWKFVEAAMSVLDENNQRSNKMPPIQFDNVLPVYGQIDVRGSSDKRNEAIRMDMIDYLQVASSILREAYEKHPISILDELIYRTEKHLEKLHLSLDSGDETGLLEFMATEVEPAFRIIAERDPALKKSIDNFQHSLNPEHEFYHMRRKDFETSLTMINDRVAQLIEDEENRTQNFLPHYFEKYKTDGIEYNIYLGQSLLQNGTFDPLFLKSFRLWQLINMAELARETKRMQSMLPVPLETTQLILCYSNPFSIMFRMDEKRFDVAGAYNIRYEIVKKRIDKAHVKGTSERITQPGTIAIIYTQEKEAREYERYFEFLEARGYILPGAEQLEVEQLQGLLGLKALRVKVNYHGDGVPVPWDEEELLKHIKGVMA